MLRYLGYNYVMNENVTYDLSHASVWYLLCVCFSDEEDFDVTGDNSVLVIEDDDDDDDGQ